MVRFPEPLATNPSPRAAGHPRRQVAALPGRQFAGPAARPSAGGRITIRRPGRGGRGRGLRATGRGRGGPVRSGAVVLGAERGSVLPARAVHGAGELVQRAGSAAGHARALQERTGDGQGGEDSTEAPLDCGRRKANARQDAAAARDRFRWRVRLPPSLWRQLPGLPACCSSGVIARRCINKVMQGAPRWIVPFGKIASGQHGNTVSRQEPENHGTTGLRGPTLGGQLVQNS